MFKILESIETGWGLDIILWFQSWRTPLVSALFAPFNHLGTEAGVLIVLPLIYWCISKSFGRRLVVITLTSSWLNLWCKNLLMRPRPFMLENSPVIPAFDYHATYGLPSGHTMLGATTAGYTAAVLKRSWVTIIAIIFMFLMGLSRMVHGVHYLQDVVIGLFLSIILIIIFRRLESPAGRLFMSVSLAAQILISLILGGLIFLFYYLSPADSNGLKDCISLSSLTAGAIAGIALEGRYARFTSRGTIFKKAGRYMVGFAGLLVIYIGLRFPAYALTGKFPDAPILEGIIRFIRYSSFGIWTAWGAPMLFIRIKLADREY